MRIIKNPAFLIYLIVVLFFVQPTGVSAATLNVPQNYSSLMAAYDAARDGDEILVAPGTYPTCLAAKNKKITIKAQYPATTSQAPQQSILNSTCSHVIQFTTPLISDGIFTSGNHVEFIGFVLNGSDDGFSYEGASGIVRDNVIQGQTDDPIDADGASEAYVIGNFLGNGRGGGDGIETRLHSFSSSRTIKIIFRNNIFYNNPHDGIQLIGIVSSATPRKYLIANNLIVANKQAGLGTMGNANSDQTTTGYPLPEQIYVINNIFYQNGPVGIRNVSGNSIASHNLYFGNTVNYENSNIQTPNVLADPKLINTSGQPGFSSYMLGSGSPAVDAGINVNSYYTEFGVPAPAFSGSAPDLGWKESGSAPPPTVTIAPTPPGTKLGDVDRDGDVDILDFQALSNSFGKSAGQAGYNANANFNGDTTVNILDFQILSNNFGK